MSNFDLISLISESQKYNDFLDKAPTISKPGKEGTNQGSTNVQIRTALGYKSNNFKNRAGETDTAQQKAYNDALSYLMGAVEAGELTKKDIPSEVSKNMPRAVGDTYKGRGQDTAADDEETSRPAKKKEKEKEDDDEEPKDTQQSIDPKPEVTVQEIEAQQEHIEHAGEPGRKDKSLDAVNEDVFSATKPPGTSDKEFKERMNAAKSVSVSPPYRFSDEQADRLFNKVPAVYRSVIERMLSQTQGKTPNITDFMEGVGAGQPSSQAGEIITMIAMTLPDDDAEEFLGMLEERVTEHPVPPPKGQRPWIDKSWIQSARDVRAGTIARYNRRYGEGNWEMDKGCWDSQTEVEAMGLQDYTKNKGYSTDTYMRLKVNGEPVLDEISLKKDLNVNLLNKTTNALVDFAIMGSEDAGEYVQLQKLWREIPAGEKKASSKEKYQVGNEELSPLEIKERMEGLQADAFNKLAQENPELAEQVEFADGEKARQKQRALLSNAIDEKNMSVIRKAASQVAELDPTEEWPPELEEIIAEIRGSKSGTEVKGWMQGFAEKISAKDENGNPKIGNITFDEDEKGNLVVQKDGVALNPDEKLEVFGTKDNGDIQKLAMYATHMGASTGDRVMQKRKKDIYDNIQSHTNAVVTVINEIPSVREGMLLAIREEFPLKALFEGEEAMALSKYNCDPAVLGEIFKDENGNPIENYEQIQDKLEISEDKAGNLSLVYRASAGGETIPVAELDVRSDGKGYGNTFKFTLKVHKEFKSKLKEGNRDAYPDAGVYEGLINLGSLGNILTEDKQNTLAFHWKKAEDDYPLHYFLRDLNEGSLK